MWVSLKTSGKIKTDIFLMLFFFLIIPAAMNMNAIGKEFEANRVILDEGIPDEEQWAQNVEGNMRGLPKPASMSEAAPPS